jgi:hypothetical protein
MKFNPKYKYLLILVLAYIITRLPFLLSNTYPEIGADTFEYFEYSYSIKTGTLPDFSVIPPLYSFLLFILSAIGFSSKGIILFQMLLNVSSIVFLQAQLMTLKQIHNWIILLVCIIISNTSFDISYETSFQTESIFKAITIFFFGIITSIFNSPRKAANYALLSLLAVLAALMRSNGMYLYFFIVLLALALFLKRNEFKKPLYHLLTVFIGLNLLWSAFNFASYGTPLFGNTYRIKLIVENYINGTEKNPAGLARTFWQDSPDDSITIYPYVPELNFGPVPYAKNIKNKPEIIINYLFSIAGPTFNFYEEDIPHRFQKNFSQNQFSDTLLLRYPRQCFRDPECRRFTVKEYYDGNFSISDQSTYASLIDTTFETVNIIFYNSLIAILNFLFFIASLFVLLKLRVKTPKLILIGLFFSSCYFLNILVVSVSHDRFVMRYEQVTHFMMFFNILLSSYGFYNLNKKK